jgi:hypothetical protein
MMHLAEQAQRKQQAHEDTADGGRLHYYHAYRLQDEREAREEREREVREEGAANEYPEREYSEQEAGASGAGAGAPPLERDTPPSVFSESRYEHEAGASGAGSE